MTPVTDQEWNRVTRALVSGGLRECINDIIAARSRLSDENRRLVEQAWDDGNGGNVTLVPTDDPPWFVGMYEDSEVMLCTEHNGTLYSIVYASGGGLVSVIVGDGIVTNEMGVAFHGISEAKAYVKGLTSK